MPAKPGKVQFINLSHPKDAWSVQSQRQAHSHAARTAHARTRRLRTIEYQAARFPPSSAHTWVNVDPNREAAETASAPTSHDDGMGDGAMASPITLLASDRRDPFGSFARSLIPLEHYLLDYYVKIMIPIQTICCGFKEPPPFSGFMTREWLPLMLTDSTSLSAILLAVCRHLSTVRQQQSQRQLYSKLALKYKIDCVQALNKAIATEIPVGIRDTTVAAGIVLGLDEYDLGDLTSFKYHAQGVLRMAEHNGGPQNLGLHGFLEHLLRKFAESADTVAQTVAQGRSLPQLDCLIPHTDPYPAS
ncbi:hypothetical protein BX600DRAFT_545695 [Xylariales sp. PMI_506]|nr:hypothetical protein BX600DRAFT_545695 [Xylariales sp. PMI_506]